MSWTRPDHSVSGLWASEDGRKFPQPGLRGERQLQLPSEIQTMRMGRALGVVCPLYQKLVLSQGFLEAAVGGPRKGANKPHYLPI